MPLIDPHGSEHWLAMLGAIIRDESGQIDWKTILSGVIIASIGALALMTVEQQTELAALRATYTNMVKQLDAIRELEREVYSIRARQELGFQRLGSIESGAVNATSDRYRAQDAQRDFARIERIQQQLKDEIDRIEVRLREVERRR